MNKISEGTASAQRINRGLHRVDTSMLGERDGVSFGSCCTNDFSQGDNCPNNHDHDPISFSWVMVALLLFWVAVGVWLF